jgi:hypothetical protein
MATRVNVILMRGLAGAIYSRGMDALGAKLAKLPNVDYITVEEYGSWRTIRDRIPKFKDPTVIGGHSFGANAAVRVGRELDGKVNIPLLVSVDPSQYWSWKLLSSGPGAVSMNVKHVLNQYQTGGFIGRQTLWRESGSNYQIKNLAVEDSHTGIDDNEMVHKTIIEAVKAL